MWMLIAIASGRRIGKLKGIFVWVEDDVDSFIAT